VRLKCENCGVSDPRKQSPSDRFCTDCAQIKIQCRNCDERYDPEALQCPNCQAPVGWIIHDPAHCKGERCIWHNPTPQHSMSHLPFILRDSGLVERACPCGVGHPDPDSVDFMLRTTGEEHWGVHGCCRESCCQRKKDLDSPNTQS
jgi:hypothetical protein